MDEINSGYSDVKTGRCLVITVPQQNTELFNKIVSKFKTRPVWVNFEHKTPTPQDVEKGTREITFVFSAERRHGDSRLSVVTPNQARPQHYLTTRWQIQRRMNWLPRLRQKSMRAVKEVTEDEDEIRLLVIYKINTEKVL